jgi:hypothetical protein
MHTFSYWLVHNWVFCPGDFVICHEEAGGTFF